MNDSVKPFRLTAAQSVAFVMWRSMMSENPGCNLINLVKSETIVSAAFQRPAFSLKYNHLLKQ